jgi:FkbM family methyltransferase
MNVKARAKALYKNMVFRLSASGCFLYPAFYRYFYKPGEDTIFSFTDRFSKSRQQVTVVQIGANDGIHNDPVHRFIKRDKWTGVLLEPQSYVFEKYLKPLYAKNKNITVLNAALDTADGTKPIYKVAVSDSRWAHGLTSFNRSILEEAVKSGYIERQAKKEGTVLPDNKEKYIAEEKVNCISTNTLVEKYNLKKIDWLQIDTEGFDFEIIKMFNIAVTKPEVIVYENLHFSAGQQNECLAFLKSHNYTCRDFGPNTLAVLNPDKTMTEIFVNK